MPHPHSAFLAGIGGGVGLLVGEGVGNLTCKGFSGFLPSEEIVNLHMPYFTGLVWKIQFICFSTVSAQTRGKNATSLCGHSPGGKWGSQVSAQGGAEEEERSFAVTQIQCFTREEHHICPLVHQELDSVGSADTSRALKRFIA